MLAKVFPQNGFSGIRGHYLLHSARTTFVVGLANQSINPHNSRMRKDVRTHVFPSARNIVGGLHWRSNFTCIVCNKVVILLVFYLVLVVLTLQVFPDGEFAL
jgi:hypothetical protein